MASMTPHKRGVHNEQQMHPKAQAQSSQNASQQVNKTQKRHPAAAPHARTLANQTGNNQRQKAPKKAQEKSQTSTSKTFSRFTAFVKNGLRQAKQTLADDVATPKQRRMRHSQDPIRHSVQVPTHAHAHVDHPDEKTTMQVGVAVLALVFIIFLFVFILHACSANKSKTTTSTTNNTQGRIASGIPSNEAEQLEKAVDRSEQMQWIAQHANEYSDQRAISLAIAEPDAVNFVYQLPRANKSSQSYDQKVEKGTYPQLYCWDSRWGFLDYAGSCVGVMGSGPTCLSMAYMGLTGQTGQDPGSIAQLATNKGWAKDELGTSGDLFTSDEVKNWGLSVTKLDVKSSSFGQALKNGVIICAVKANSLTTQGAHYVLITKQNANGTVVVFDPTSTNTSNREWALATLVSNTTAAYGITKA